MSHQGTEYVAGDTLLANKKFDSSNFEKKLQDTVKLIMLKKNSLTKPEHFQVPPHWEETVCLVGLRPFLNVETLTLTNSCLALIAANNE